MSRTNLEEATLKDLDRCAHLARKGLLAAREGNIEDVEDVLEQIEERAGSWEGVN